MRRTKGFRRSGRSSRPIRAREWDGFTTSPSGILGEPGRIILSPNEVFFDWAFDPDDLRDFYDEPTLVRSLIFDASHASWDGSTSPSISCSLYVGLIKWKNDNFPVTEGPFADDTTKDWIYWAQWMMFNGGTSSGVVLAGNVVNPGDRQDIRTKRKFQSGEGLLLAAFASANNSHDVIWGFNARCLLLNG